MNMTASAFSTASTIERPRPPDRAHGRARKGPTTAAGASTAAIVASLGGRTGKTLLARILADYFLLSGTRPLVFDTDAASQTLRAAFPYDTTVADLDAVRDQMILFDTLAIRSPAPRVADVSHHVFRKFFRLMQDSDFVTEARMRHVEPVIFYIPDRTPEAYGQALMLRDRFVCTTVLVDNGFIGEPKDATRRSPGYRALEAHHWRMSLPRLEPELAAWVEEGDLSLGEIISQPLSRGEADLPGVPPFEQREALRAWLLAIFRDIHRVIRAADAVAPPLLPADPLA